MIKTFPQSGHLVFFPACWSLTRNSFPHWQVKLMGMVLLSHVIPYTGVCSGPRWQIPHFLAPPSAFRQEISQHLARSSALIS
jgi:hypothetical protein